MRCAGRKKYSTVAVGDMQIRLAFSVEKMHSMRNPSLKDKEICENMMKMSICDPSLNYDLGNIWCLNVDQIFSPWMLHYKNNFCTINHKNTLKIVSASFFWNSMKNQILLIFIPTWETFKVSKIFQFWVNFKLVVLFHFFSDINDQTFTKQ